MVYGSFGEQRSYLTNLKKELIILVLFFSTFSVFSQVPTATKKVDIVSKSGQKINFSEIKIESDDAESYKTLEIRYKKLDTVDQKELVLEETPYKCFPDKKEAIKYYYLVKKHAPTIVIYYVYAVESKKPEVFTFRVAD